MCLFYALLQIPPHVQRVRDRLTMKRRVDLVKGRTEEEEKAAPYLARREALAWNAGSAGPSTEPPPPPPPPPPQHPPPLPQHTAEAAGPPAARRQMPGPNTSSSPLTACSTITTTTIDINQVRERTRTRTAVTLRCSGSLKENEKVRLFPDSGYFGGRLLIYIF